MLYSVTHTTRHLYQSPVLQSINELRLTPRSFCPSTPTTGAPGTPLLPGQQLREINILIEPEPASWQGRKDYFGNEVTTVALYEPHRRLVIEARSMVEVQPVSPPAASGIPGSPAASAAGVVSWEDAREIVAAPPDEETLAAVEYVFDSPFVSGSPELARFAQPTFTPGRPLVEALGELSHRIHSEFRYQPNSTSIEMPLLEVLRNRQGVCQDFAHVMIGTLRSLRLPARYASGYLRSSPGVQGAEASHAWVSVYVPGSGWLSYDPTNDMMPSDGHVTLAWGRDYGDVTPVKGVAIGGGAHSVEVAVRVTPIGVTEPGSVLK